MTNKEGGTEDEEYRVAAVIDRVNTTFEVLQSTTISCVQCHSHPYDPIKHEEYYKLMAFFNNTVDSDQNQNAPRMRIFNDKEKKKNKEMYSWILKYGNESELKLFKNFIEFINPVYQANKFEVIDKQKAYFLSHIIGLRNGGSVILKNANTLKNNNLYISNISYKDDVKIIFRKDSSEGKVLGELDFNKDKKST